MEWRKPIIQCNFLYIKSLLCFFIISDQWFVGCFPDTKLVADFENAGIPGDTVGSGTNFTNANALLCAVKCSTADIAYTYAAFSQTGLCICMRSADDMSNKVNSSLCVQKSCSLLDDVSDCDGETYHWLVNASKIVTAIKILDSGTLQGSVPQNITLETIPGKFIFPQWMVIHQDKQLTDYVIHLISSLHLALFQQICFILCYPTSPHFEVICRISWW